MEQIKKRNGVIVPFDKQRIINAINKAFLEVDGKVSDAEIANKIAEEIHSIIKANKDILSVEDIQNKVEECLMKSDRLDVARSYIRYRYKRKVVRDGNDDFIKAFSDKISAQDIENANANIDEMSFGGRVGAGSDLMMKRYALDYCVSSMARNNHLNNEIYIHKLNSA